MQLKLNYFVKLICSLTFINSTYSSKNLYTEIKKSCCSIITRENNDLGHKKRSLYNKFKNNEKNSVSKCSISLVRIKKRSDFIAEKIRNLILIHITAQIAVRI